MPSQSQEDICTPFPNPREGWPAIDTQIVSKTASQHPFIQRTAVLTILCAQKTLPELYVKIANIKTWYFGKSSSKFLIHNSQTLPAPQQVSELQLFSLILSKMLPLGQQLWYTWKKAKPQTETTCCRKKKIIMLDEKFAVTTTVKKLLMDITHLATAYGPFLFLEMFHSSPYLPPFLLNPRKNLLYLVSCHCKKVKEKANFGRWHKKYIAQICWAT